MLNNFLLAALAIVTIGAGTWFLVLSKTSKINVSDLNLEDEEGDDPVETVKPVDREGKIPSPKKVEVDKKRNWSFHEMIISIYCLKIDLELLPYSKSYIAKSIGRTPGAMLRKGYRLLSNPTDPKVGEILSTLYVSSQEERLKSLYYAISKATEEMNPEISLYFFDEFKDIVIKGIEKR